MTDKQESTGSNLGRLTLESVFLFVSITQILLKIALLRYNLGAIQLTYLKCTIHLFLLQSQNCITVTIINLRTFSSLQKETPQPFVVTSQRPSLAAANLLSVSMDLSILGILYKWYHLIYGLCAWLLSRHHAFKVRPCCGVYQYFHFYLFLNNILSYDYVTVSLSIHQFMDI